MIHWVFHRLYVRSPWARIFHPEGRGWLSPRTWRHNKMICRSVERFIWMQYRELQREVAQEILKRAPSETTRVH